MRQLELNLKVSDDNLIRLMLQRAAVVNKKIPAIGENLKAAERYNFYRVGNVYVNKFD
ncbi:hypothetical protein Lepto7375DRAFT_7769 [Leptolyngbya sp. PCC 7375]|nr:hypothetical protein Lepto7375DRAFT_7769 [Leptolyngbya sp. PCC 7375]